jgi:thiamine kinase-like enzyme
MKLLGQPATAQEEVAERALATLAGPDAASLRYRAAPAGVASPSYHGVESTTFEVALDGKKAGAFLKVSVAELAGLIDHRLAFAAAERFSALGFSPRPLGVSAEHGAILFERLDEGWRAARIDDLVSPARASRLVEIQKAVANGAPFERPWSVFGGIETLWNMVTATGTALPGDAEWLRASMQPMSEAIATAGVDLKPAHGDPHTSNVMISEEGELRLVDCDMAADLDPYYQLGVQMNELYQFESEMKPLLEMHDGRFTQAAFNRCRLYAAADDFYWALRAMLMEATSPRRGVEFLKYAEWRFLRCRMLVQRPGFEELIRSI